MAVVAFHALLVEVHDDGRMLVITEDARLVRHAAGTLKVVDNRALSPIGTPREAATHLRRAADLVATQLAETPVLEWGPHREPTPSSATPAPEAN
ncbi:hypothetical protein OV079_00250 [Nannocystis pusilla]|uniref:Uncharacterized protein n=1 Tax=Nannocystis pusilla TaxID=889268 RepID=A0A9X3ERF2_9BACT|nr:hypothetical protein [Nannocystis pusilla]MCY1004023.1 hypothetical protein [Nannocystis pusilla]